MAGESGFRPGEWPGLLLEGGEDFGGWVGDIFDTASGVSNFDPDVGFISTDPNVAQHPALRRDAALVGADRLGFMADRRTESDLINDLQLAAAGQGPSVAQAQLEQGLDASQRQQMSMARSAQGGAAQRNAMLNQATMNAAQQAQETSREAGIQRAQEQIQARGELGGQLTSRQQNIQNQGALDLERARANQEAQLAAERMRADVAASNAAGRARSTGGIIGAIGGLLSDIQAKENITPMDTVLGRMDERRQERDAAMRELSGISAIDPYGARARESADMGPAPRGGGAGGGGGGGILGSIFSDARSKEDIDALDSAERRAMAFRDVDVDYPELATPEGNRRGLAPMEPYRYRYTEDAADRIGADRGMRTGIMAQDMERSPYLRDAVVDTPNGKAIDGDRALSGSLAAAAGLDKRLRGQEEETIDIETRIADLEQSLMERDEARARGASDEELRRGSFGRRDILGY